MGISKRVGNYSIPRLLACRKTAYHNLSDLLLIKAIILQRHLYKTFMKTFGFFLILIAFIIFMFEALENLRAFPLTLVSARVYLHVYRFFPFVVFVSMAYFYHRLIQQRTWFHLQHLGFSRNQFILNALIILVQFSVLDIALLKPMQSYAQQTQERIRSPQDRLVWFHEKPHQFVGFLPHPDRFLHFRLVEVTPDFALKSLVIAPEAWPKKGVWYFKDPIYLPKINHREWKTAFPMPQNLWVLPRHQLWFTPLFLTALWLLAYSLAMRPRKHFFLWLLLLCVSLFFAVELGFACIEAEKIRAVPMLGLVVASIILLSRLLLCC